MRKPQPSPHGPATRRSLSPRLFAGAAPEVARALLGSWLVSHSADGNPDSITGGVVVETEAYDQADPASHSCRGPTPRNVAMFGPGGHAYVYRSYGIHWCLNVTCAPVGHGAAVLIRALQPVWGAALMARRRCAAGAPSGRRPYLPPHDAWLCSGPGKLTQALAISGDDDGQSLTGGRLQLWVPNANLTRPPRPVAGPRIGIRLARAVPWRFSMAGSIYVSRPWPPAC